MSDVASRQSAIGAACAIYRWLDRPRRVQFGVTLALMVLGAFAETATVGAVLPFLAIVTGGREAGIIGTLALGVGMDLLTFAAGLLIAIAVLATGLRLVLLWVGQRFVHQLARDLAQGVYRRALYRPYGWHVQHNSSETLAGMEKVQFLLGNVLLPVIAGTTAAVVAVCLLAALLVIDPAIMTVAAIFIAILYGLLSMFSYRRLHRSSDVMAGAIRERVQLVQEGLGGIRDVLLDRSQAVFLDKFAAVDGRFREAQGLNQFLAGAPRFVAELAGVLLIAVIAVIVARRPGGLAGAVPVLGALALGAQRLLPLVQQVYFSWSQIYGHRAALIDVAALLVDGEEVIHAGRGMAPLASHVRFDHVSYAYPGTQEPVLRDVSLDIPCGARIGLAGPSGSGKSTFVDLLLGLLEPSSGHVLIDGQSLDAQTSATWQAQVAHVPQTIFLADASIAANIAFGVEDALIDAARVKQAAQWADIHDFIAALPQAYETQVGERGERLSGGQRQRIGIARALYKQAALLVFDEATSALDDRTEAAVMASIEHLPRSLTIVIIAHRLTTLRQCDRIVSLDAGRIAQVGSYESLISQS